MDGSARARLRLLRAHFLWRFVDNDALSPDVDRREALSFVATALIVPSMFLAVLLSLKYLFGQDTPGIVILVALDDKLTFVSLSMIATGLLTVLAWDALSLDDRDRAILGSLPLEGWLIARAKIEAVGLFVGGILCAVNLWPLLVFPLLHVAKLQTPASALVPLYGAHAVATLAAGLFTAFAVIAVRELMRLVVGDSRFRRHGAVLQAMLVVLMVSHLLLLPVFSSNVGARLSGATWMRSLPPLWFLGLHERIAGGVELGVTEAHVPRWFVAVNARQEAHYRIVAPSLTALAPVAWLATAGAAGLAAMLLLVNAGRSRGVVTSPRRGRRAWLGRVAARTLRHPVERAGCLLAWQALTRSPPHRLALAVSAAVAVAATVWLISGVEPRPMESIDAAPLRLLAVQLVVLVAMVIGAAHARRLPADPAATWGFRLAWPNRHAAWEAGVGRAMAGLSVVPALVVLLPLHGWLLGWRIAAEHAAYGVLLAALLLEASRFGVAGLSLMAPYAPDGNLKTLAPVYGLTIAAAVVLTVHFERWILSGGGARAWAAALAGPGLVLLLRAVSSRFARRRALERELVEDEGA